MANLALFCDGTWDTPELMDAGLPAPTNVVKLSNLVDVDSADPVQKLYYHPGVGTDAGLLSRLAGGGMGQGLDQNIKSAYRWLASTYRPGDRIFIFGFSRGAYTARSLAGMIWHCGLLDLSDATLPERESWARVDAAFDCYRGRGQPALPDAWRLHGAAARTEIHFLGVWDTVGALGIPEELALLHLIDDPGKRRFHDTALSPIVLNARHAVAIDERRETFVPTLWSNVDGRPGVKQTWFPGTHGDVGGGYGRCGLSDGALWWMAQEAQSCGLALRTAGLAQVRPDQLDVLHDSCTGLFRALRTAPRAVPEICAENVAAGAIHDSALLRQTDPPLAQAPYWRPRLLKPDAPTTCAIYAQQRWNATGLYLSAGRLYHFSAKGEWLDGSITCGPEGNVDHGFHLGDLAQMASDAFGSLEGPFQKLFHARRVDFWYTKRQQDWPWFALVGVIANGSMAQDKDEMRPHEVFLIGAGCTYKPQRDGYLYCFANDAWQMYANNRGSVTLTVIPEA